MRSRPAARLDRGHDLHVRVHVLRALRSRDTAQRLPELRRRLLATPRAPTRPAREVSALDEARAHNEVGSSVQDRLQHAADLARVMLSVAVNLDRQLEAMLERVLNTMAKRGGDGRHKIRP